MVDIANGAIAAGTMLGGVGAMAAWVSVRRGRAENARDHGTVASKIDRVARKVDTVTDKLDQHIEHHNDRIP